MLGELRKYLQFCTPFHSVCQFTDETYVPLARCGAVRMSWGAWGAPLTDAVGKVEPDIDFFCKDALPVHYFPTSVMSLCSSISSFCE